MTVKNSLLFHEKVIYNHLFIRASIRTVCWLTVIGINLVLYTFTNNGCLLFYRDDYCLSDPATLTKYGTSGISHQESNVSVYFTYLNIFPFVNVMLVENAVQARKTKSVKVC